jgi:Asp-tRNA(Asn)/Glu-tRNA(Gln) amidotransferase A subunit family amidase
VGIGDFARLAPEQDFAAQTAFSPYCSGYNLTGQPAVSLPVGMTRGDEGFPAGLPVGVQLAAGVGRDGLLLAVAARLEEVFGWARRHPPGWAGLPSATVRPVIRGARHVAARHGLDADVSDAT